MKEKDEFIRSVQYRVSRVAVGASTVRGQGAKGIVDSCRTFLFKINLTDFVENDFEGELDKYTYLLIDNLKGMSESFGLSRKVINIFLRDCFYSYYLNPAFNLKNIESKLELPLDSLTAKKIIKLSDSRLITWPGVKHLQPDQNRLFQNVAESLAKKTGRSRVHLDNDWWGVRE